MKDFDKTSKIFVAGHNGLVGSAVVRRLRDRGYVNILTRSRAELNLRDPAAVAALFAAERPVAVVLAAAKVGGIHANDKYRGDFIRENLEIQNSVIGAAFDAQVTRLCFLGSSCIYPRLAPQPLREDALLTGPLEPTNDAYAIAKIAGLMYCRNLAMQYGRQFFSVMPTNVYGPNDRYDLQNSHVLPALLRKCHEAKLARKSEVVAWGSGAPYREFIFSDDLADAIIFLLENYTGTDFVNIGTGQEITIRALTELVARVVGFPGKVTWDTSKPDGTPRKLLDSTKLFRMGWQPRTGLEEGIRLAYADYCAKAASSAAGG